MSAIGSFYVISDNKRAGMVEAAEAQFKALRKKRLGFLPPKLPLNPDPFWQFVRSNAKELDDYPFSGYLLMDVEQLAPNALSSKDQVGIDLSRVLQSSFVSYLPRDAEEAVAILDSADFSEDAIKAFFVEEGREHEVPDIVAPIQQSAEHLKKWLGEVCEGQTGILAIG
ncbi:MAG: hypothetical protein AAGC74_07405 [Verrucomicrobiota bacterium]